MVRACTKSVQGSELHAKASSYSVHLIEKFWSREPFSIGIQKMRLNENLSVRTEQDGYFVICEIKDPQGLNPEIEPIC